MGGVCAYQTSLSNGVEMSMSTSCHNIYSQVILKDLGKLKCGSKILYFIPAVETTTTLHWWPVVITCVYSCISEASHAV